MAYSKPERKRHQKPQTKKKVRGQSGTNISPKKPPRVGGVRKTRKGGKKPAKNPTVKLNQASGNWARERYNDSLWDQRAKGIREQVKTGNNLRRRGLAINESNWKRYYGSKKL
jgi:hypothetical protein